MPWKSTSVLGERGRFAKLALKAREGFARLCRKFGISRKTGYKWLRRFCRDGGRGLKDRSRRPRGSPTRIRTAWVERIARWRHRHPTWGARKIGRALGRQYPGLALPSVRTIANWLRRRKLSQGGRRSARKGPKIRRGLLSEARRSNEVWTIDFKGWFRTADGQRVHPLTVRDLFSRFVLGVRLLPEQSWWRVQRVFRQLVRRYGCPAVVRVDNGGPFGSLGPRGLSRLSAWWTGLGIEVEFIAPGHPEQNAGHEQMHRVLKAETTRPPSSNPRAQQRRMHAWVENYNRERPHEALGQRVPAELYQPGRSFDAQAVKPPEYPADWAVRRVRSTGEVKWRGRRRHVGEAFVGYRVGLQPLSRGVVAVFLGKLLLGELRDRDAGGIRAVVYARRRRSRRPRD